MRSRRDRQPKGAATVTVFCQALRKPRLVMVEWDPEKGEPRPTGVELEAVKDPGAGGTYEGEEAGIFRFRARSVT